MLVKSIKQNIGASLYLAKVLTNLRDVLMLMLDQLRSNKANKPWRDQRNHKCTHCAPLPDLDDKDSDDKDQDADFASNGHKIIQFQDSQKDFHQLQLTVL